VSEEAARVPGPIGEFALRCDRCHHFLADAGKPMQLVALFKPSPMMRVPKTHSEEQRYRCRHCAHVHVFHPADGAPPLTASWRDITLK
jgi:hypothetical protein